jgi:hypothetical protein
MTSKKVAYAQKLKDPRWQKMRLKVLERDDFTCRDCGDKKKTLHVHHMYYEWDNAPWEYEIESLVTLCEECHEDESLNANDMAKEVATEVRKRIMHFDMMIFASFIRMFFKPGCQEIDIVRKLCFGAVRGKDVSEEIKLLTNHINSVGLSIRSKNEESRKVAIKNGSPF